MSIVCPVSDRNIDGNAARLNALLTFGFLMGFFFTPVKWIIFLVAVDFLLRRVMDGRFSYVSRLSILTSGAFGFKKVMINAGPKLFAANVGFVLSLSSMVLFYAGQPVASYALAGVLAFFIFLEGFFKICAACILYPYLSRIIS